MLNKKLNKPLKNIILFIFLFLFVIVKTASSSEFSNYTFLIAEGKASNLTNSDLWRFLQSNKYSGIELKVSELNGSIVMNNTDQGFTTFLNQIKRLTENDVSKVIPVFLNYDGDILILDSVINNSSVSSSIFYLPQGETWPSLEYLIQSNRRIVFFVSGEFKNESRILHKLENYVLRISANEITENGGIYTSTTAVNLELLMIDDFEKLPTNQTAGGLNLNLIPDYINYLLANWTKFGKRPNFIFTGTKFFDFDFIISQLNSFTWINGTVKVSGKTLEKVYWRNPDVSVTGSKFSFPYRGGEELMLSAFAPGYIMTPKQIVLTGEMEVPENYSIIASPVNLGDEITGNFSFENQVVNSINPSMKFNGENYSFSQDIERGSVLRLPENASINLGNPENFGLRNSSFTVSCFVKFTEILEFGDNAVLGNYESEYRRGLHLILRSGHPYFGLWANDYISEEKLQPNIWYHLVWRYIIETGEQAIFLNGKNIGTSNGHPPFSGTGEIQLGSAISKGASLRGYVDDLNFWSRSLGHEEINRLALNEEIVSNKSEEKSSFSEKLSTKFLTGLFLFALFMVVIIILILKFRNKKKEQHITLPEFTTSNKIQLFGDFEAISKEGENVTRLFTPKVKELFLFVLLYTIKNGNGARITDINEHLWPGTNSKNVANNRAVTLNKLRKILVKIQGVEIVLQNKHAVAKIESPFFCDYLEAFKLCQITGGIPKQQLPTFFNLVKNGRFLKGTTWIWLDEIRGITGNQVIDNLLNLASIYKKENKLEKIDAIAKRILDYDDLNEEAIFLQIWVLQKTNNSHLAKFNFNSFCTKYKQNLGEPYPMEFVQFTKHFSSLI